MYTTNFMIGSSGERVAWDDKIASMVSLFGYDTLLPAEYLETLRRKTHLEPEKKLMFAVLNDAVSCFQNYVLSDNKSGKMQFLKAERWILQADRDWPFSFENICAALRLDPDYLRAGLMRWKQETIGALYRSPPCSVAARARRRPAVRLGF